MERRTSNLHAVPNPELGRNPSRTSLRRQRRHQPSRMVLDIAAQGAEDELVDLLCRNPSCVITVSEVDWRTALHAACFTGHAGCVRILIEAGADINARMRSGVTPLIAGARSIEAAGADARRSEECVRLLIDARADLKAVAGGRTAVQHAEAGGWSKMVVLLRHAEEHESRLEASAVLQRQVEALRLADEAETVLAVADLSRAAGWGAMPPTGPESLPVTQRNALFYDGCELLHRCGFPKGSLNSPPLEAFLETAAGRSFLSELAEQLPIVEAGATGRETAYALRLVQLRIQQAAPALHGDVVGQDQLTPLLERVLVAARHASVWSVYEHMLQIPDDVLLQKPDLASAADGWLAACGGVEHMAVAQWRSARVEAIFWKTLGGGRMGGATPQLLRQAISTPHEPLPTCFRAFVAHLTDVETTARLRSRSTTEYLSQMKQLVDELLPTGTQM